MTAVETLTIHDEGGDAAVFTAYQDNLNEGVRVQTYGGKTVFLSADEMSRVANWLNMQRARIRKDANS